MPEARGQEGSRSSSPHPDTVGFSGDFLPGWTGTAFNHGAPVARTAGEGCVTQRVRGGRPPLPNSVPPRRAMFCLKTPGRDSSASPYPYSEGPALGWFCALCPPPSAGRESPQGMSWAPGLFTLGTSRTCWAFLLGLGPSAETLVLLCVLSPPRPRGEASQGPLRSALWPPLCPAFCQGPKGAPHRARGYL